MSPTVTPSAIAWLNCTPTLLQLTKKPVVPLFSSWAWAASRRPQNGGKKSKVRDSDTLR
uniref:Uncharacterized protein n=1 Tax=Solanum lycopersicum TaxID=4081 RepID=A0A3Q7FCA5_SOLLC